MPVLRVRITSELIVRGKSAWRPDECPAALAITRLVQAWVLVTPHNLVFMTPRQARVRYRDLPAELDHQRRVLHYMTTPPDLAEWVKAYDLTRHGRLSVGPKDFDLEVPDTVPLTEAGMAARSSPSPALLP